MRFNYGEVLFGGFLFVFPTMFFLLYRFVFLGGLMNFCVFYFGFFFHFLFFGFYHCPVFIFHIVITRVLY